MAKTQTFLCLMLLSLLHFAASKPNGFSLELIHRDSQESPFYPGKLGSSERINRLVESSKIRAHNLDSASNSAFRLRVSQDYTIYLVKVRIGTPGIPLYLVADTGSDLIWTQCEPCTHRYHQLPPIFNSTASNSFRELNCQHQFCRDNHDVFGCKSDKCVYTRQYTGGSKTEGIVSQDIVQSATDNDRIPFYFGCSRDNQNFSLFEHTSKSGGIMGLNMSPVSILQQLRHMTNRKFSYCLHPYKYGSVPPNTTSLIRFGSDVHKGRRRFHSTPFVTPPNRHNYYVNLLDISVAGNHMNFPHGTFAVRQDGTGGTIVDSGTALTFITQAAYPTLLRAFQNYFDQRGFQRVHLQMRFDLCYSFGHHHSFDRHASVTFHLQGADFAVNPENVYLDITDHNAFCVAIAPIAPQHRTIIGAINQGNTRFIFDAAARQLLFTPEHCQHNTM